MLSSLRKSARRINAKAAKRRVSRWTRRRRFAQDKPRDSLGEINAIRSTERRNRVQEARRALEAAAAAYPQDSAETATLTEALALIDGIR